MTPQISVLVRDEKTYNIVKYYNLTNIYTDNLELAKKYPTLYYQVPRVPNHLTLPENILVSDVGTIYESQEEKNIITDIYMNVANKKTIELLIDHHVKKINLSVECSLEELKFFDDLRKYPIEVLIYGRVESMILKKHPYLKENGYTLEDYKKRKYPVKVDQNKVVRIFHQAPINHLEKIKDYRKLGITRFRVDFLEETEEEIQNILKKICKELTIEEEI